MPRRLPAGVWLLGWISLLTDAASEAIYPLLPFYLTRVLGAGPAALGLVEGAAEATSSLLRIASGWLSDRWRSRRPLVIAGYTVSSAVRPLIALARSWGDVFAIRVADRVGKGVRSAPRDVLLAQYADVADRGRVFGFHRAMDHAGAVIGPLFATAFLFASPGAYRTLFLLTAIPGALAVLLVTRVRETAPSHGSDPAPAAGALPSGNARPPRAYFRYLGVLAVFMLGNSSDAFLLLRLTDAAGGPRLIPILWALLHVVKAGLSTVAGAWSDRIGRKPVIVSGWLVYAIVYAGFAITESFAGLAAWLMVYGVFFALTEGTEKALVADLTPAGVRGMAFGLFHAVSGAAALAASVLFGWIWTIYGAPAAFLTGAGLAVLASVLLVTTVPAGEAVQDRGRSRGRA